jgi:non-specific serine/threonine protein kinase
MALALRARITRGLAYAAFAQGDIDRAAQLGERAVNLAKAHSDAHEEMHSLNVLALALQEAGQIDRAASMYEQALVLAEHLSDEEAAAYIVCNLGWIAYLRGDHALALARMHEGANRCASRGDTLGEVTARRYLGDLYVRVGQPERALVVIRETLARARNVRHRVAIAYLVGSAAAAYADLGEAEHAARLIGAAEDLGTSVGMPREVLPPNSTFDVARRTALASLGRDRFEAMRASGRHMDENEVALLVLGGADARDALREYASQARVADRTRDANPLPGLSPSSRN